MLLLERGGYLVFKAHSFKQFDRANRTIQAVSRTVLDWPVETPYSYPKNVMKSELPTTPITKRQNGGIGMTMPSGVTPLELSAARAWNGSRST